MANGHMVSTSEYLMSTESVVTAARRLQNALENNVSRARLEYTISMLELAAEQQENKGADYHAFMFSELEATPETDKATRERATEDVLASVLTDFSVANVLMAGGQSVGDIAGVAPEPDKLKEALFGLQRSSSVIERSLASPLEGGPEPGRFGFAGAAEIEPVESPDLPTAIETFRARSTETLASLVNDAKDVVMSVVEKLSQIDFNKVFEAMGSLGDKFANLSKVGGLFRRGVKKFQDAFNALLRLLGGDLVQRIKEQVQKVWEGLKSGKYVSAPLEWAFGVEKSKARVEEVLKSDKLILESLDNGSLTLARLKVAFNENMGLLSGVVAAVSLAAGFLAFIPAIGTWAVVAAASINMLILGGVILIGMDYTDSGILLKRVSGVGEITNSLLVPAEG